MELFYYRGSKPNLGDDLNSELWPEILPPEVLAADGFVLVGFGSILSEQWLGRFRGSDQRLIILGTGTSYDVPPAPLRDWLVLAVRGPLTASVLGMPETSATDGAVLLADAPRLVGPARPRTDVVFVPHHRSIRSSPWSEIAEDAGMRFVSPQWPLRRVLDEFASARLVLAEAMHGAIIADTLRIPWIPLTISPVIDEFKWRDWLGSVGLEFQPVQIPAGDPRDLLRYDRMARVLANAGMSGHANIPPDASSERLRAFLAKRFAPELKAELLAADHGTLVDKARAGWRMPIRGRARSRTVDGLRRAAATAPFLSADSIHHDRLEQLREAVGHLCEVVLGGS